MRFAGRGRWREGLEGIVQNWDSPERMYGACPPEKEMDAGVQTMKVGGVLTMRVPVGVNALVSG